MSSNGLQFFTPFQRTFKGPLDVSVVFSTEAAMLAYLDNEARYAGQVVSCKQHEGSLFILNNNEDEWLLISGGDDKHKTYTVEHSMEEIIQHNLGKTPAVQIHDSNGNVSIAQIHHIDHNTTKVTWIDHFSGKVTFN